MAVSGKYGKINIPKIGAEEPIFILRAQDRLAQAMVEIYRIMVASHDSPMTKDLDREIEKFRNWKGNKKMPD
jgi:hypothetical protein